jgi:hypothetical protein
VGSTAKNNSFTSEKTGRKTSFLIKIKKYITKSFHEHSPLIEEQIPFIQ